MHVSPSPENSLTLLTCKSNSAVTETQHDRIFSRLVFNKTYFFFIIYITRFSGLALGVNPRIKKRKRGVSCCDATIAWQTSRGGLFSAWFVPKKLCWNSLSKKTIDFAHWCKCGFPSHTQPNSCFHPSLFYSSLVLGVCVSNTPLYKCYWCYLAEVKHRFKQQLILSQSK